MRDSVGNLIHRIFDLNKSQDELRKSIERHLRDTFSVTTNKAHDKIEMIESSNSDEINTRYLKRIKDSGV